ncbi:hypothetical protein [Paenibacillus apii]|uniref:hypothetical protein n=1 Tax=Paenibacillus apii TaxID=1850370 RepID=UPI00143B4D9F|nr:hypothetical protein [Paenibacillus apii]NJJ38552.1 hypothetical protein [Paenibacillus apii]
MNVDRNIKLLLYKLGRNGHDVSLIKDQRYNRQFDSVSTRYKLTFWLKGIKKNKKTGEEKECNIPDTHEFSNSADLLRYMVVRANERKADSVC